MSEVKYLTIIDTAERFGVSPATIYRYFKEGKFRAVKAGRRWAIELESVRPYFSDEPQNILDDHKARRTEEVNAAAEAEATP